MYYTYDQWGKDSWIMKKMNNEENRKPHLHFLREWRNDTYTIASYEWKLLSPNGWNTIERFENIIIPSIQSHLVVDNGKLVDAIDLGVAGDHDDNEGGNKHWNSNRIYQNRKDFEVKYFTSKSFGLLSMVVSGCQSSTQFSIEIEININLFISVYTYLQLFLFFDFDFSMRF